MLVIWPLMRYANRKDNSLLSFFPLLLFSLICLEFTLTRTVLFPASVNHCCAGCIIGAFIMNANDIMNALQSKLDIQTYEFRELVRSSLESHAEAIHNTLHEHLLAVDSKVANTSLSNSGSHLGVANQASRSMKLNVPRFDGSNPQEWIFQIETFFNFHATPAATPLQIVSFHLDGRFAAWF
ncbi:hypothetical protein Lalb_Chr10g0106841 [Lupinus albus]|uniref:Uncharacterized protein n=1 Tax=Lupinus albus TaxID=3870 RepID=A0A6A4PXT1_LUPAL|nr:hypothetical protein Lalb_Chr10g0106841 [Lupinus albus]